MKHCGLSCLWLRQFQARSSPSPPPRAFVIFFVRMLKMPHGGVSLYAQNPHGGASGRVQMPDPRDKLKILFSCADRGI